jgi:hypothetical protein
VVGEGFILSHRLVVVEGEAELVQLASALYLLPAFTLSIVQS